MLKRTLFNLVPTHQNSLYQFCKRYVDRYHGDNNDDIRTNGEWRFLQSVLPGATLVFDVGANVGDWARLALDLNRNVTLHCFEPSAATFARLLKNGFPPQVVCNNFGLGSRSGEQTLLVFGDGSGMNSLYPRQGLGAGWGIEPTTSEETIRIVTFDEYVERLGIHGAIDLCKIDVEGHELEVLRGMVRTLQRRLVTTIQFEYGGCNLDSRVLLQDMFEFLQPFGYELYKIHPAGLERHRSYDRRLENFQYQNWVASVRSL